MNENIKTIIRHVLFIAVVAIFVVFVGLLFGGVEVAMELLFGSTVAPLAMLPSGNALTVDECMALREFNTGLCRLERDVISSRHEHEYVIDGSIDILEGSYDDVASDFVESDGAYVFSVLECPVYNVDSTDDVDDCDDMDVDHYMDRAVALAQGYEWE